MTSLTTVRLNPKDVLALLPPYPIVLATTRSNIITINQVQYFTFAPLRLGIAVAHTRYTYELLKEERAFVVNIPDAGIVDVVELCGKVSGRDGDKFERAELTRLPLPDIQAVGIAECGAHIACHVEREIVFENRTWFVGPVVGAWRRENHQGTSALMCGREAYRVPGDVVAPR